MRMQRRRDGEKPQADAVIPGHSRLKRGSGSHDSSIHLSLSVAAKTRQTEHPWWRVPAADMRWKSILLESGEA
ncbi:hypothetical protein V5799_033124 [Amblyomma americanum]|uniref:Uncharacterized protein n=1 Tax=Amblyomma americanum TaxID=6943 RepID=A0AAQ4DP77_AMBAM